VDKAIFPGLQGGPHEHSIAGIAIAFKETMTPSFKAYAAQVIKNAKALAQALMDNGLKLVSGGTDNHLILIDLTPFGPGKGIFVQEAFEHAHITANKNTIPNEPASPFFPSGIRLGTPSLTTRGFQEQDMKKVGKWLAGVINEVKDYKYYPDKEKRQAELEKFRKEISQNENLKRIRQEISELCKNFPVPGIE
jgi:glycine hydroxymethyltransferase